MLARLPATGVHVMTSEAEGAGRRNAIGGLVTQGLWFALASSLGFAALALAPGVLPAYFAAIGVRDAATIAHGCSYLKAVVVARRGRRRRVT